MEYLVNTISSTSEIESCEKFHITQYNWGGDYRPITYGYLGFIPNVGFYLKMICEENNPTRVYKEINDPVHLDSAMEAFLQFYPGPDRVSPYFNFEFNANGALHVKYGVSRKNRTPFSKELIESCQCKSEVFDTYWTSQLLIPLPLIHHVFQMSNLKAGDTFMCNFYKIKESPNLTHFGSFAPIKAEKPDFHRPEFFIKATICE